MAGAGYKLAHAYVEIVPQMQGVGRAITSAFDKYSSKAGMTGGRSSGAGFAKGILGTGAVMGAVSTITSKAFNAIASSLNGAISRVDTMNNFPKVMKNLGYSAQDAAKLVQKMSDRLQGLPTSLDSMTGMVQQLAPVTGSMGEATDLALALNDALLAGGKSTQLQANALEQYNQMLSAGKPDMQAWRSLMFAMPGQLNQVAKSLLGASANSMDLYEALKKGNLTFDDFNQALLKLDKEGLDGFGSFEQQARAATEGIGTAFANMQTRIRNNVAKVIDAIGGENIAGAINTFSSSFNVVGDAAAKMVTDVKNWLGQLWGALQKNGAVKAFIASWENVRSVVSDVANMVIDWVHFAPPDGVASRVKLLADHFSEVTGKFSALVHLLATGDFNKAFADAFHVDEDSQLVDTLLTIRDTFIQVFGTVSSLAGEVNTVFEQIFGEVSSYIEQFASAVLPVVMPIVSSVLSAVQQILPPIKQLVGFLGKQIMPIIRAIGGLLISLIPVVQAVVAIINVVIGIIAQVAEAIISALKPVIEGITSVIGDVIQVIQGVIDFVVGVFTGNWSQAWDGIKNIFGGIWNAIGDIAKTVMAAISAVIQGGLELIKGVWSAVWGGIKSFFGSIMDAIGGAAKTAMNILGIGIKAGLSVIRAAWNAAWSGISSFFSGIWNGLKSAASNGINTVIGLFRGIQSTITGIFSGAGSWLVNAGKSILNGLLGGLKAAWDGVTSFVGGIGDWIVAHKGPISYDKRMLIPAGRAIMGGLSAGLATGFRQVESQVSGMTSSLARTSFAVPDATITAPSLRLTGSQSQVSEGMRAVQELLAEVRALRGELGGVIRDNTNGDVRLMLDERTVAARLAPALDRELGGLPRRHQRGVVW